VYVSSSYWILEARPILAPYFIYSAYIYTVYCIYVQDNKTYILPLLALCDPLGNRGEAICASKGAAVVLPNGVFCHGRITKRYRYSHNSTNVSYIDLLSGLLCNKK
jgi:hypothetical protein